ncbi:plasmid partitioning protein RepB (plasmid) [Rhizobium sp. B230/85]|uniref:plasmid partitioning protein RepB n=1 Tax=unclassified Rhizobium TaxID=2613769 RepID=UPI001ADC0799|nr:MULTISPECIES: plasmid partitioning protein RepB [unclassified Rhizobium]MBO9136247.1 plasmid partitioning protein RepB [Rhizobium sp. B209b/85]QXZ99871.1 plasmid partitioning protein RepB [Rhizobium sp. B230/85]
MKGRDILKNMVSTAGAETSKVAGPAQPQHKPAGAVRAMNLSLGRLGDEAAAAKELRSVLATGDKVVELNPQQIEASFIRDRIPTENDAALDELITSMRDSGQQVPILVRPHSTKENQYQAAYGHRRLRAAIVLGRPVKAIVRHLTDEELIVAQGQENGPRVDLSFIERALFAKRLEQHGFDRERICQALSVDRPETSRLLQVTDSIPIDIILAIGPASKIGRPRWLAFAELLKDETTSARIADAIGEPHFAAIDSNERFAQLWVKAQGAKASRKHTVSKIRTRKGVVLASMEQTAKGTKITVTSGGFGEFIAARMSTLVEQFEKENPSEAEL